MQTKHTPPWRELGGGIPVSGDTSTATGCETLVRACESYPVQILINNFGGADPSTWLDSDDQDWHRAYEKNVLSAQRITTLPKMLTQPWGRIINLGTVGSTQPNSRMPAYYAAKGALATMTMSLAKEVAGSGIRVNDPTGDHFDCRGTRGLSKTRPGQGLG